jgi:hypothetical protein
MANKKDIAESLGRELFRSGHDVTETWHEACDWLAAMYPEDPWYRIYDYARLAQEGWYLERAHRRQHGLG